MHRLKELKNYQSLPPQQLQKLQLEKLNNLLNHAYENVEYYKKELGKTELLKKGRIEINFIEELAQIPFLTKDLVRSLGAKLYSKDHQERGSFMNSSGGSTGEPTRIMQDREYLISNLACFELAKSWRGVGSYDSEIILWGAERDTFEGKKPLSSYVGDFLRNRIMINCYKMTPEDMTRYIQIINRHRPAMIRAYADAINELACFVRKNDIHVEPQNVIHPTAGTLFDYMREEIEDVFQCRVFNHYGSREVGAISSECPANDGMHIFWGHIHVEVVDPHGNPCDPGQEGEIVVTSLDNYSMPIIRYKIADVGIMREPEKCKCGVSFPRLASVSGRTSDFFRTRDGRAVTPIYFAQLLGVYRKEAGVEKFQVIQKDYDHIKIKLIGNRDAFTQMQEEINNKIKIVMGDECRIEYEFVDEIETSNTGKARYAISEIVH